MQLNMILIWWYYFYFPESSSGISAIQAWLTFAAVVVALFGKWFWDQVNKPKLIISVNKESPYCGKHTDNALGSYYLRIIVRNGGITPARNVEVLITQVEVKNGNGDYKMKVDFIQSYLQWTHDYSKNTSMKFINPNTYKTFDFGIIDTNNVFSFSVTSERLNYTKLLSGKYRVALSIGSSNANTKNFIVEFEFENINVIKEFKEV